MKRVYIPMMICCFVLGSSVLFGQKTSRQTSKRALCSVGDIAFICPKGFKLLPAEPGLKMTLFFRKEYDLGLFVASPDPGFDEGKYMSDVAKTALAKFFPKEPQTYSWKPVNYSDSISKYEIGGGMVKAFNGNLGVIMKYRRVKAMGKDFFVGYIAEIEKGGEARAFFDRDGYADSMPGCNASVEVIYSVTGEKMDEDKFPCELVIPTQGLN